MCAEDQNRTNLREQKADSFARLDVQDSRCGTLWGDLNLPLLIIQALV
jgi:hypothetical protein